MTLEESDHCMSQIADVLVNTSGKLNLIAELNLVLGRKLDRLADLSSGTGEKLDRLADKIDKLAELSAAGEHKIDRLGTRSTSWRTPLRPRIKRWIGWSRPCFAAKGNEPPASEAWRGVHVRVGCEVEGRARGGN